MSVLPTESAPGAAEESEKQLRNAGYHIARAEAADLAREPLSSRRGQDVVTVVTVPER